MNNWVYKGIVSVCIVYSLQGSGNRDRCKVIGDPCWCSNTGLPGYCLPGRESKTAEQLYCDCSSDVLSLDEIVHNIIRTYYNDQREDKTLRTKLRTKCPRSAKILNEIVGKLQHDDSVDRDIDSAQFNKQRKALVEVMHKEPLMAQFYTVLDGCSYPGQECTCQNTGRKGACSIGRRYRSYELYCHCE